MRRGQVVVVMEGSPDPDVTSHLLAFVERTSDLVGVVDDQSRVLYLNEAARKRLGVGDSTGLTSADLFPPHVFARYYDEIRPALLRVGTWHGELAVLTGSGDAVPMAMTVVGRVGPGGEVDGLVTLGRELSTHDATTSRSDAVRDELTGLPGRAILDDRLRIALAHAARDGRRVAAILVDVDGMKDINDSFGHAVGDDVLRELARTMLRGVRASDSVARLGGDEFVVLLDGLEETDTVWQVAERLRDAVCRAPIELAGNALVVTASFGLAVAVPDDTPEELLQRADAAMYRAKAMGGAKVVVFDDSSDVSITHAGRRARLRSQPRADPPACAVGRRPRTRVSWSATRGSHAGSIPVMAFSTRSSSSTSWRTRRCCRSSTSPCSGAPRRPRRAAARNGQRVRAYGHLSRRLLGDVNVERYLAEIVDDLGIAPSDLCVEIAHPLVTRPSRTVDGTLRALREIRRSHRAERRRRRMRGQRDRRVRIRRAPSRPSPRPRRRPRPDATTGRARHHRARPSARPDGRSRSASRPNASASTCATPGATTARAIASGACCPRGSSTDRHAAGRSPELSASGAGARRRGATRRRT